MINKSFCNHMIDSWNPPVIQAENGKCKLAPNGFPKFHVEADTVEMVVDQARKIAKKELEDKSIVEIDQFFKDFNAKI